MRQTCSNTVGPSPVRCSLYRIARRFDLPSSLLSRRLRAISGRSRRSLPSCFDQVEREQHRLMAPALAPQRMEVRRPVVAGDHSLAVDQKRRCLDVAGGVNDGRKAVGPVMAVAREAPDPRAIPAHHQPVAVVLDFVNPRWPGRWPRHFRRQARFDKAGGTPWMRAVSHRR